MPQRREISLSDVPALAFALASLLGATGALFVSLSSATILFVAVVLTVVGAVALGIGRIGVIAKFVAYFAVASIVCFRGTNEIGRDVRRSLIEHVSDTAIVSCRGVVVWRDEATGSEKYERLWLSDVHIDLQDTSLELGRLRVRISVAIPTTSDIEVGDIVAGSVRLETADYVQHRSVQGLCWTLRERVAATGKLFEPLSLVVIPGRSSIRRVVFDVRKSISKVFEEQLAPDARAVAGALLIGTREEISSTFRRDLQLTGLAHLFALSGLNTGLLVSLCWLVMAWLRIPQRLRYAFLIVLLVVYAALGLGVPSLIRSAIMAGLVILSRILSRPSHPINLLLFAAGIELLIWPLHILDAGFILSYLSMAGILTAYVALNQPLQELLSFRHQKVLRRTIDTLSSTLGAQLATAPTAALMFGRVPGLAIVTNVIAIPLFSLLVVLTLCVLFFNLFSFEFAAAFSRSIELLVGLFAWITSGAASIPGASLATNLSLTWGALAIACQITAIIQGLRGRLWSGLAFSLIALNVLVWPNRFPSFPDARLSISETKQVGGESAYVRLGNISCLVGCGPTWTAERTAREVANKLSQDDIHQLDLLVVDSRRAMNIGGAPILIKELHPEIILDLGESRNSRASFLLDAAIQQSGARYVRGMTGLKWQKENSEITVQSYSANSESCDWTLTIKSERGQVQLVRAAESNSSDAMSFDRDTAFISLNSQLQESEDWNLLNGKWAKVPQRAVLMMKWWDLPRKKDV